MAVVYLGGWAEINLNPSFNWELEIPICSSEEGMERSLKLPPHEEARERPEKEADHSILVGGGFNLQGSIFTRLIWGYLKMCTFLHMPPDS